ncbi:MAG TPA: response regulator transcription factor [Gammaproteobacteria bacterium]|nr:response regulator transcription factor [Gammaproteobacteria bacterium]
MKILLADDHQLFLDGLCAILEARDVGEVVCVRDGHTALAHLVEGDFDVALIDLRLPGRDGLGLLEELAARSCLVPVIIVTASEDPDDRLQALEAGAMGFIPKSASGQQIAEAVLAIQQGQMVGLDTPDGLDQAQRDWARMHNITPRQLQVLRLVRRGLSNQAIAERLSLSTATVKSHLAALFQAFNTQSRTETIEKAHRLGLE